MPKYSKVEDSKSLTVKLSRTHHAWVRETASDLKIPPAQVIARLIDQANGVAAKRPTTTPAPQQVKPSHKRKAAQPGAAPSPDKAERLALFARLDRLRLAGKITRMESVEAITPGKKESNYDSWKASGIPGHGMTTALELVERLESQ